MSSYSTKITPKSWSYSMNWVVARDFPASTTTVQMELETEIFLPD
jgi:hypothetical protein